MPTDPRPGRIPFYWPMEAALREQINERCAVTGRTLKDELTEALLHWLELPPSLSTPARAALPKRAKKRKVFDSA